MLVRYSEIDDSIQCLTSSSLAKGDKRKKGEVCFACRKPGHSVNNCPKNKQHANICYNCGTTEHRLKDCKRPRKGSKFHQSRFICVVD